MSTYHTPVLLRESIDGLAIDPNGTYVDVTYGGGGHSKEILKRLKNGRLIAFDQDADSEINVHADKRLIFVRQNFIHLKNNLKYLGIGKVNGPQPIPESIDYNLWTGPAKMEPLMRKRLHYDWHWVWNTGNGELGNNGVHFIDVCRWALGQNKLAPRVLSSEVDSHLTTTARLLTHISYFLTTSLRRLSSRYAICREKKAIRRWITIKMFVLVR